MLNDMNYLTNGCQNFNENNNITSLEKDYESSKNNILLTSKPTIRKKYLAAKSIPKLLGNAGFSKSINGYIQGIKFYKWFFPFEI